MLLLPEYILLGEYVVKLLIVVNIMVNISDFPASVYLVCPTTVVVGVVLTLILLFTITPCYCLDLSRGEGNWFDTKSMGKQGWRAVLEEFLPILKSFFKSNWNEMKSSFGKKGEFSTSTTLGVIQFLLVLEMVASEDFSVWNIPRGKDL